MNADISYLPDDGATQNAARQVNQVETTLRSLLSAVEQAPVSIIVTDVNGVIEYVNPKFTAVTGYSAVEVRGKNPRLLKSGKTPAAVYSRLWETLRNGQTWQGEFLNRKKNGEFFWEAASISPVRNCEGIVTHYVGVKEDITEKKRVAENLHRAEEALRESERRYRILSDSAPIGIFQADGSGRWNYANRLWQEISGKSVEESLGLGWNAALHPDDRQVVLEIWIERAKARSKHPISLEFRIDGAGGKTVWVELRAQPIVGDDGNITEWVGTVEDVTAAKGAQSALRDSERRQKTILDHIPDPAWLKDREGRYLAVNKAWTDAFGLEPFQAIGKTAECAHPLEFAHRIKMQDATVIASVLPQRREVMRPSLKGQVIWYETQKTPLLDKDGNCCGLVGIARDVTKRRRAEKLIRQERDFSNAALNSLPGIFYLLDAEGKLLRWNAIFETATGYSATQLATSNFCDFFGEPELTKVRAHLAAALQDGTSSFEAQFVSRDGRPQNYFYNVNLTQLDGKLCLIGAGVDISRRLEAETALRDSEERYRALFDRSLDCVFVHDFEGRILDLNPAACSLIGYVHDEIASLSLNSLLKPEEMPRAQEVIKEVLATGTQQQLAEFSPRRKDGSRVKIETKASLVLRGGKPYAILGIARDLTAANEAKQELLRAKEAAEHANRSKGEFLATMSHEIRTPMNGMIGMTGLLLDTNLNSEQRRYAELAHHSGQALLAVLNDILDFSKVDAGKLHLDNAEFELPDTVESTAELLALKAHEKGLRLICSIERDVPAVLMGDAGRLRQVLVNLGGNAIKFTEKGEVIIGVSVANKTADRTLLHFTVSDTGCGIPIEKHSSLFSPFSQLDASSTRKHGGTGLGLAICKKLTALMGGNIDVQSEPGKGAKFWFTASFGNLEEQPADAPTENSLENLRVLVADAHAVSRRSTIRQLESLGCQCSKAVHGHAALIQLTTAQQAGMPFHILIMDRELPDLDEAKWKPWLDQQRPDLRCVLLSPLGKLNLKSPLKCLPAAAELPTPVRRTRLRECLINTLRPKENGVQTDAAVPRPSVAPLASMKVLVAEDNPTNQLLALKLLERFGCAATAAATGKEVLEILKCQSFDVVLMDCQMPVMDGLEATRQIRSGAAGVLNPKVPIVAVTASAMNSDRAACESAGMNDYLSKPIDPQRLQKTLERCRKMSVKEPGVAAPVPRVSEGNSVSSAATPASQSSRTAVLDLPGLLGRVAEDTALAKIVAESFLQDIPDRVAELQVAIARRDRDIVLKLCHQLKGASATVGGLALRTIAADMESAARGWDWPKLQSLTPSLEQQFSLLRKSLEQINWQSLKQTENTPTA